MPATGSILLDTTIVVSVLRRAPGMQEHIKSAPELWLPLFALGELEYGVSHSSQPEKQRHALSLFLQGVDLLFPSETTAREYGRIKAEWRARGLPFQKMICGSPPKPSSTD
jgi:predicted nucleic acid-binding protein